MTRCDSDRTQIRVSIMELCSVYFLFYFSPCNKYILDIWKKRFNNVFVTKWPWLTWYQGLSKISYVENKVTVCSNAPEFPTVNVYWTITPVSWKRGCRKCTVACCTDRAAVTVLPKYIIKIQNKSSTLGWMTQPCPVT